MKTKIYTKTGDKGTTHLVDGSCIEKFNPRVEAYGCVDELNSFLGVVRSCLQKQNETHSLDPLFEKIQNQLFNLGSLLACPTPEIRKKLPAIQENHVRDLENKIDEMTNDLPELRNFILPAGHEASVHLHVARTSCRRAERRAAEAVMTEADYSLCLQYLNRLSDLLFVAARWVNLKTGNADVTWKKSE
ncbi:MAG: cob(I)yrinic acid a,c-diamide adenosyltransferase [Bdellovibrionaceae bacterium]|nr:cob(I)yrinic acid a,c-diamide adenosyltransferase [Pseudobdellovibrionaceae bacterium]